MILLVFNSLGMLLSILGRSPHPCRFVLRLELSLSLSLSLLLSLLLVIPSCIRLAICIRPLLVGNKGLDLSL